MLSCCVARVQAMAAATGYGRSQLADPFQGLRATSSLQPPPDHSWVQDVPVAACRDEDTHPTTWHDESQGLQHPHGLTGDRSRDVELSANVVQPQDVTRLQVTVDDASPQGIDDIDGK